MKVLQIIAHPNPESFNHAIARSVQDRLEGQGHIVRNRDLYAENFDPVLRLNELPENAPLDFEISDHISTLLEAEALVIVHPNWWGQPPAILRGWVDRVFRNGYAYDFHPDGIRNKLHLKKVLVLNTSNTTLDKERELYGDPLEKIWIKSTFAFIGIHEVERRLFSSVVVSTLETRQLWLEEAADLAASSFAD